MTKQLKNALIAEAVGSYFLYLIIGSCIAPPGAGAMTPVAVGLGLVALVYSAGHLSKAHFNPATTAAYLTAGTHSPRQVLSYTIAIFASMIGAALTVGIFRADALGTVQPLDVDWLPAIVAEFLFTFALMWVILNVAIAKKTAGNEFYGFAIGAIVLAGAYSVGPISLAAFNPAVTLAMVLNGYLPWPAFPIYTVSQVLAAVAAALLFRSMGIINEAEYPKD